MTQAVRRPTLVVAGTGMAGTKLVEEVLTRAPGRFDIRMFGGELPEGRVLLSGLLDHDDLAQLQPRPLAWFEERGVRVHAGVKVEQIDRRQRLAIGGGGKVMEPYDVLVLATGARPAVPPGLHERPGAFVFRTVEDCLALGAHARDCERAAVVGKGRLAELAAGGLRRFGLEVEGVEDISRQTGADLVVYCGEDEPNVDLTREAGIEVGRGIVVDEECRTSDPCVYAVGACAEAGGPVHERAARLAAVLTGVGPEALPSPETSAKNKVEAMKARRDGLDVLDDLLRLATNNNWQELTEDDKQQAKWHGLFFRKQTPGHFMLRLRFNAGQSDSRQFRVIADLSDEFGKGFCDLTTRQQVQMRWFTLADTPAIWRRLEEVGLHSGQTGMDNVRGVCGCPVAGLTPNELFDASPVVRQFNDLIVGNREFTNLPRKFNVTISGCLENCCHSETQDIALVPAYRELDGQQVNGFNVLVGGKQGSGGYRPATPLDVFLRPEDAAPVCAEITRVFRDHGPRAQRNRARLAFLIEERGIAWFRAELERRWGRALLRAGTDLRRKHHVDHLGIHPQKRSPHDGGPAPHHVGLLVPVGRITTAQMRAVAGLADRYGSGAIRVTPGQNLIIPNVPEDRIGALTREPLFEELPFDPSPIMRGLVACTGTDYCHMALIETKGWAVRVARELERRAAGKKVAPLTIHWSGCSAGCGLHQAATIGLQGCRSRVNGEVVDAAHVCVKGGTGPTPAVAADLMYDVPCEQLADALEPLVRFLPR